MAIPLRLAVALALCLVGAQAAPLIPSSEISAKAAQGLRLIELGEGLEPVWKTEDEKEEFIRLQTRFVRTVELLPQFLTNFSSDVGSVSLMLQIHTSFRKRYRTLRCKLKKSLVSSLARVS